MQNGEYCTSLWFTGVLILNHSSQLHENQEHPDTPLLDHVKELIAKLESQGVQPSPEDDGDDGEEDGGWEDVEGSGEDEDVEMS